MHTVCTCDSFLNVWTEKGYHTRSKTTLCFLAYICIPCACYLSLVDKNSSFFFRFYTNSCILKKNKKTTLYRLIV